MPASKPTTIDEYIAAFPEDTAKALETIRDIVKKTVPGAAEMISYAIPAFKHNGTYLVYFAGYKKHVSMYPVPKGDDAFNEAIAAYASGKSTAQFPLHKPLPVALITKFVEFSRKGNKERARSREN